MSSPLSDRMRPKTLKDYIGQEHLVGEGRIISKAVAKGQLFSLILWGPPGVGKTTLARILAKEINAPFYEFSAVTTGIAEIKKIIEQVSGGLFTPIVFIDEIHRFNKAQQDAFLPIIESGKIIFVGATTENPSFEIIKPLLSRARVVVLKPLTEDHFRIMIDRALDNTEDGLGLYKASINDDARTLLISSSGGDGRWVLNTLEIAVLLAKHESDVNGENLPLVIDSEMIVEAIADKQIGHDKSGDAHYDLISAFIKSMRASDVDAALYYLARMIEGGEDPIFIARRMVIFASEDIGMAQSTALVVANAVFRACEIIGYPECSINLAHGVVHLARAPKNRSSYDGLHSAQNEVKSSGALPIPIKLRNAPTQLMKEMGYGKGYEMYGNEYLPEEIASKKFFE